MKVNSTVRAASGEVADGSEGSGRSSGHPAARSRLARFGWLGLSATEAVASPGRIAGIDIARGVAVLAVVLFHTTRIAGQTMTMPGAYGHLNWMFGLVRMPLLMLVSGLLAGQLLDPTRGRSGRRAGDAAMRAIRLGWIFLAWVPVTLGFRWALAGEVPDLLSIALELAAPRSDFWYLWALALLTASLPIARRAGAGATLAVALIASVAAFADVVPTWSFSQDSTLQYALFFYLGAFGCEAVMAALMLVHGHARLIAVAFVAALAVGLAASLHALGSHLPSVLKPGWSVVEATASCAAVLGLASVAARWRGAMPLAWIGRRTLPIYLAHSPLLLLAVHAAPHGFAAYPAVAPVLLAAAAVCAALLLEKALVAARAGFFYSIPAPMDYATQRMIQTWLLHGRWMLDSVTRPSASEATHPRDRPFSPADDRRRHRSTTTLPSFPRSVARGGPVRDRSSRHDAC